MPANPSHVIRRLLRPLKTNRSSLSNLVQDLSQGSTITDRDAAGMTISESAQRVSSTERARPPSTRRRISSSRGGGTRFRASGGVVGLKRVLRGRYRASTAEEPSSSGSVETRFSQNEVYLNNVMGQINLDLENLSSITNWTEMLNELNLGETNYNPDSYYHQGRRLEIFARFAQNTLDMVEENPSLTSELINFIDLQTKLDQVSQHLTDHNDFYTALEQRMLDKTSNYLQTKLSNIQNIRDQIEAMPDLDIAELNLEEQSSIYHKQRALLIFLRRAGRDLDRLNKIDPGIDPFISENITQINDLLDFVEAHFENNPQFVDDINNAQLSKITNYIETNMTTMQETMDELDLMTLDSNLITDPTERASLRVKKRSLEIFSRIAGRDLDRMDLELYSNPYMEANLTEIDTLVDRVRQHLENNAEFYTNI